MVYLVLLAALVVFLLGIKFTGLIGHVSTAATDARQALTVIQNTNISEDEKEAAVQAAALRMFASFFGILARAMVAVVVSILLVLVSIWAGLCTIAAVEAALTNWLFIVFAIVVTPLIWLVIK